MKPRLK